MQTKVDAEAIPINKEEKGYKWFERPKWSINSVSFKSSNFNSIFDLFYLRYSALNELMLVENRSSKSNSEDYLFTDILKFWRKGSTFQNFNCSTLPKFTTLYLFFYLKWGTCEYVICKINYASFLFTLLINAIDLAMLCPAGHKNFLNFILPNSLTIVVKHLSIRFTL